VYKDGCECVDDANSGVCTAATNLGSLAKGQATNVVGLTPGSGASDWFVVAFPPNYDTGLHGTGSPTISLSVNPNGEFAIDIVPDCSTSPSATCTPNSVSGVAGWAFTDSTAGTAWSYRSYPWPATVYVRVYRIASGLSCDQYTLAVSR